MNTLVIGSGGRESALAWKIKQSPLLKNLYILPGNGGTAFIGENVNIKPENFNEIKSFVKEKKIEIIVVGPEAPLVKGIRDFFYNDIVMKDLIIVGPSSKASIIEASKSFAKDFMIKYNIPTAKYKTFSKDNIEKVKDFLTTLNPPYVIKADGLASGKGVTIHSNIESALNEIHDILINNKFGKSGEKIVIEEFLVGKEVSVFILTDGENYLLLPEAKDYKRIGENDTGPNTGGMGAISPVPYADNIFMKKVKENIILPTLEGLKKEGIEYKGFIFFGLMNVNGEPYVIEFNCRLGDPETQAILPRIKNDLLEIFLNFKSNNLGKTKIEIEDKYCATVVIASKGYPGDFEKGKSIKGLENISNSIVFHAGTKIVENNEILTDGGRVLSVTSLGNSLSEALEKCYNSISLVNFDNMYFRKDIGRDLTM